MMKKVITLFSLLVLFFLFCNKGVCQYADLVGKRIIINGPKELAYLGVAADENTCKKLYAIFCYGSADNFEKSLKGRGVTKIKNRSKAFLVDVNIPEKLARITILEGFYKGLSGWIPITWLDENTSHTPLYYRD